MDHQENNRSQELHDLKNLFFKGQIIVEALQKGEGEYYERALNEVLEELSHLRECNTSPLQSTSF